MTIEEAKARFEAILQIAIPPREGGVVRDAEVIAVADMLDTARWALISALSPESRAWMQGRSLEEVDERKN